MKVKLLEHYQDAQVHYLPDQEVEVGSTLGAWLVEHRKAVRLEVVIEPVEVTTHIDPEPVFIEVETPAEVEEMPWEEPVEEAPEPKRSKRGRK